MSDMKKIIVTDTCSFPEIGGISGPIVNPVSMRIDAILKMVNCGRHVYECNPADIADRESRVLLTVENYNTDNFSGKVETPVTPEPTPVVTQQDTKPVETPVAQTSATTNSTANTGSINTPDVKTSTPNSSTPATDNKGAANASTTQNNTNKK